MSMDNLPQTLTPENLKTLQTAGQTLSKMATQEAPDGGGDEFAEVEKIFNFITRFTGQLETVKGQLEAIQGMVKGGNSQPPTTQPAPQDTPQPTAQPPAERAAAQRDISTIKVYQSLLSGLNQIATMRPDMTVAQMLEYARDNKQQIIGIIDSQKSELWEDG